MYNIRIKNYSFIFLVFVFYGLFGMSCMSSGKYDFEGNYKVSSVADNQSLIQKRFQTLDNPADTGNAVGRLLEVFLVSKLLEESKNIKSITISDSALTAYSNKDSLLITEKVNQIIPNGDNGWRLITGSNNDTILLNKTGDTYRLETPFNIFSLNKQ